MFQIPIIQVLLFLGSLLSKCFWLCYVSLAVVWEQFDTSTDSESPVRGAALLFGGTD